MMKRATEMIDQIIAGWQDREIDGGLRFLAQVVERVEQINDAKSSAS